nr:MAG TPA: hypothetical protein [Caudoviricetes sp.]
MAISNLISSWLLISFPLLLNTIKLYINMCKMQE